MTSTFHSRLSQTLVFLIIFGLIFSFCTQVLFPKWEGKENTAAGMATFYRLPKNSIDVLFIGASSFRNGISPLTFWQEQGFTSYLRATSNQHPAVSYYYLVESLKYQQPRVVVLDGITIFSTYDLEKREPSLRRSIDPMRFSKEKLSLILEIVAQSEKQGLLSYLFPLLRYHDRWKELSRQDLFFFLINRYDTFKGQFVTRNSRPMEIPPGFMQPTDAKASIHAEALVYLERSIEFCQAHGIEVMLVSLPKFRTYNYSQHRALQQVAQQHNLPFIEYADPAMMEAIDLDLTTDMDDANHLNIYGSLKISRHLGALLSERYDLPNRRADPAYAGWHNDLRALQEYLATSTRRK